MGGRNLGDVVEMILMQGGTFEGAFTLTDETGAPIDSNWRGRLELRSRIGGDLIAVLSYSGDDGTLRINDYGNVQLTLTSAFTETLSPTADSLGLNANHYSGDIEVWRLTTPTVRYKPETPFRVFVRPEVTTG